MEKIIILIVIFFILIFSIYQVFFGNYLCPIYKYLGIFCPGCGLTRMFRSILNLEIYQAFRYNMLGFILLIVIILYIIYLIICFILHKRFYIPNKYVLYGIIILVIIFTILRNIFPYFSVVVV